VGGWEENLRGEAIRAYLEVFGVEGQIAADEHEEHHA
jgi:hypothetical protein